MSNAASHNRSQFHEERNAFMIELIPELNSQYALGPIAYDRWRKVSERVDDGSPCFAPADVPRCDESGKPLVLKDYVYVPKNKRLRAGYYHLRTQEAYVGVYDRIVMAEKQRFGIAGRFRNKRDQRPTREEREKFRYVKKLIYNRLTSPEPDDLLAQRLRALREESDGDSNSRWAHATYLPALTWALLSGGGGGS